ncbi:MAG: secondary thiamine-phosphate synthase enzyme YjbQ [Bacteroidetes bacterium]|nr:secondary thiamine-phosphate synthase enzyme YjbQ [Bacteroidota bacterium]
MEFLTGKMHFQTNGNSDIKDLTADIEKMIEENGYTEGSVHLFVPGSTAALTTIEFEPGLLKDYPEFMDRLVPSGKIYHHDMTWHDGNGHSHIRAALQGPSLLIPFINGKLTLGTWQQVIFIDFDTRPRERTVVYQFIAKKNNEV